MPPDATAGGRNRVPRETARVLTLLALITLTMLAGTAVAPALPGIASHFAEVPAADLLARLLLTVPSLAVALAAPGVGWLLDRFGRKRILLVAVAVYTVAGTAGAWLDSLEAIVASRALLGLAVAATTTTAVTLIGDYYAGAARNRLLGLLGATGGLSGMLFLLAGGALAEISWRAPFLLYASAIVIFAAVAKVLEEPSMPARGTPEPGTGMAGRALSGPRVLLIAVLYLFAFGVQVAFYSIPVQLPFHLVALGVSAPRLAGAALAVTTVCAAAVALAFPRIRERLRRAPVAALQLLFLGAGLLLVARARSYAEVLVAMVVVGAPMGLNFPNLMEWLLGTAPPLLRGRVVGGLNTALFLGQFLSPILLHPLVQRGGFEYAYRVSGMGLLAGGVAFALAGLRWRHGPRRSDPQPKE
ncbi:MAG: MFS transporter [Candidatus Krumholzibacteria bacterium]|nr:MFS transporter [Candidatus Krumholzibacteria bacterium]